MSDLLGIIAPLRKFLSNTDESIKLASLEKEVLNLKSGRKYKIPDFQREIRWSEDNISLLLDDLESGPRFLGNVILTQHGDDEFSIIDGQQRTTVLTMIINSIDMYHGEDIDVLTPCSMYIESFSEFEELLHKRFSPESVNNPKTVSSDKLHQKEKYVTLWNFISNHNAITDQRRAGKLLANLEKSKINLILNRSDDISDGIRYFIDVNLKGRQLDTEDIFKSYLFKNDSRTEIRNAWYQFKTNVAQIENLGVSYPLLKLLEHYFYCDLYKDPKYKGLEFNDSFQLKKEFKTKEDDPQVFQKGYHIVELINSKKYMLVAFDKLNRALEIMIQIAESASITSKIEALFPCVDNKGKPSRLETVELKVIHNLIKKVLRDKNLLPKALIMKYILTTLLDQEPKTKEIYRRIYGVYLLSVLFVVFENTKSKDVLLGVLKSDDEVWYTEAVEQINSYFDLDKITDARLQAQFKLGTNEEEEDNRFRCKSLATVYNFFVVEKDSVVIRKKKISELHKFVTDDEAFSVEHFIINDSSKHIAKVCYGDKTMDYTYEDKFYKRYVNSIFNFLFIPGKLNEQLENYWLPQKRKMIMEEAELKCEYSKMIMEKSEALSDSMYTALTVAADPKDGLDLFFARDYKEKYIVFAKDVLKTIMEHIKIS